MRYVLMMLAVVCFVLGGCNRQGSYRNVEDGVEDWQLPGPKMERKVFGPMSYEEVKDFVEQREQDGWRTAGYEPVDPLDGGRYIVIMERWAK